MNKFVISTLVAIFSFLNSVVVHAESYGIKDLGTLGGGTSYATAINNNGIVVGGSRRADQKNAAFVYDGKKMIELLSDSSITFSHALDINDSNVIVGSTSNRSFIYENNQVEYIYMPGRATHINNINQTIGFMTPTSTMLTGYAYLYENGNITNFSELFSATQTNEIALNDLGSIVILVDGNTYIYQDGAISLLPFNGVIDIDNSGQILCRYYGVDGKSDICRFKDGVMEELGDYDGLSTILRSMNENGYAVGEAILENVPSEPFQPVYDKVAVLMSPDGSIINLNDLKIGGSKFEMLLSASDINDAGQIVGTGLINGVEHAYLLTPRGR